MTECEGGRISVDEFPQSEAEPNAPASTQFQQAMLGELTDQTVGGRQREAGPVGEFGQLQGGGTFRKGFNDPDYAIHHGIT
ncbi:hypothetical protein StoSoilA2_42630 [Arthrobacter sp. StoSoilA2]|nr:hypothetical protein StoSoilA2_42630 [Arthrobacter sp. StoSoilA2]